MAIDLSKFVTQLLNMVIEADTELSLPKRNQIVKQAVIDYSRVQPEQITQDVTGDGGKYYGITNLTSWMDEQSQILSIEYPAPTVASDETPVYLEPSDWQSDYYDGTTRYIFLPNHAPASTESLRVRYTAPYLWTAGTITTSITKVAHGHTLNDFVYQDDQLTFVNAGDSANLLATHQATTITDADNFIVTELSVSVPDFDFFAICNRAACLACHAIAAKYSRSTDSTIVADSVNAQTRAQAFSERAMAFCEMYEAQLGLSSKDGLAVRGHAAFVDVDPRPSRFRHYLFQRSDR